MDKYHVLISPQAYRDLDELYDYIKNTLFAEKAAENLVDRIEKAIISLETMPYRGAERMVGRFAYQGYRQLFVNNFTIIYRIEESASAVIIITIRYSRRNI